MITFNVSVDRDGIALCTFDVPGRSTNTVTDQVLSDLVELATRIKTDTSIKGAIIVSGKRAGYCAGADLDEIHAMSGRPLPAAELPGLMSRLERQTRAQRMLETSGKPIATVIEGLALGGGLELALACHYRVAVNDASVRLGLPEITLGLVPAAGGTQRLPRLIGVARALPYLMEGKQMSAEAAHELGVVDEVVAPGEGMAAARRWLMSSANPIARWDRKDFVVPGGIPSTSEGHRVFMEANAAVRAKAHDNYPAQLNLLRCLYEGIQVPIDAALRIELRYFIKTLQTPQARAMTRTQFLSQRELRRRSSRPGGEQSVITKATVLGAGMMGAGIAYAQALAGIQTVLIDTSLEAAERGKEYSRNLLERAVARGSLSGADAQAVLARIHPTTDYDLVDGSQVVVEAVFEDRAAKADVIRKVEAILPPDAVLGTNTSTLPITGLAELAERPERFIGIHFFSPVDRMALVEVIVGRKTSRDALASALGYVRQIRKVPIVVNDSRGFYTSRCFRTFLAEGHEMLAGGVAPALIENMARAAGMPRGPLELTDDVAIDLAQRVNEQTRRDLGGNFTETISDRVIAGMAALGRYGRKNRKGFYDYLEGGPKRLWAGLSDLYPVRVATLTAEEACDLRQRFLCRQAVEAVRCLAEGVVTSPRDADVGAVLGWGFAPWTGGPLSFIDAMGASRFVALTERYAASFGNQFAPSSLLHEMASKGVSFYRPEETV